MIGFNAEVDNLSNRNMTGSFLNLVEVMIEDIFSPRCSKYFHV